MEDFTNEDIDLFISSYERNLLDNVILNSKIPIWVEFLKAKKHYRINGMDEDYFFKKRFSITNDDIIQIYKLFDRIKRGKKLVKTPITDVQGNNCPNKNDLFSRFDENENYDNDKNKFEILSEVQDAMNDYYKKMKKEKNKKLGWKDNKYEERTWNSQKSVENIPDKYYTEDINSERPNIQYDHQEFAKSKLYSMNKTNIISKIDKISNIIENNNLISNDIDDEYKRSIPNLSTKKKNSYVNYIDDSNVEKNNKKIEDPNTSRFWQDQDLMNPGTNTRNSCVKNSQPFENQFQYLDCNYNRVIDPRLLGESSRLENKSMFKR
jgi:hypothetical protein